MIPRPTRSAQHHSGPNRELHEFLRVVGDAIGGGVSHRDREVPPTPPTPLPRSRPRTRPGYLAALLGVALLAMAVTLIARVQPAAGDLPTALHGHWQTGAATFAGRELVLTPDSIAFGTAEGIPTQVYPIVNHRPERGADEGVYLIEYATIEGMFSIRVRVQGDELRLLSREDMRWFRTSLSSPATP